MQSWPNRRFLLNMKKNFYIQCPNGRMVKGYFKLKAKIYYSNRPDLDNSLKILLDCLQQTKTIDNDRYCVQIDIQKFIDKKWNHVSRI